MTQLINAAAQGQKQAAEKILPLVYEELRRLAAQRMRQESKDHTLQATALVHEAFLRLVGPNQELVWDSRGHFFAAAAEAMRRILIEIARRKQAIKHGGEHQHVEFKDDMISIEDVDSEQILTLDIALEKLVQLHPELVEIVKLKYFAGLSIEEIADTQKVSVRTVKRQWSFARAWLRREMEENPAK
jgi:RNA polymerase sigma factor (TIGR02999 family)